MTATPQQKRALVEAAQALIDAVKIGGDLGVPGGHLYAALIGKLSLQQFESLMSGIVSAGYLTKRGDLYFYVKDLLPAR